MEVREIKFPEDQLELSWGEGLKSTAEVGGVYIMSVVKLFEQIAEIKDL